MNQLIGLSTGNGTAAYFAADIANSAGVTGVVGATGRGTANSVPRTDFFGAGGNWAIGPLFFIPRRRNSSGLPNSYFHP